MSDFSYFSTRPVTKFLRLLRPVALSLRLVICSDRVLVFIRASRMRLLISAVSALPLIVIPSSVTATTGTLIITSDTTLTEDHFGNVQIAASNVTLDCADHTIFGPGASGFSGGIDVQGGLTGVAVERCKVTGFQVNGIYAGGGAANGRYQSNELYGNGNHGMHLDSGSGYIVVGNTSRDNGATGIVLTGATQSRILGNRALNNRNWSGIALFDGSHDNIVVGNSSSRNAHGFDLVNSSRNELRYNVANSNEAGVGFQVLVGADNILEFNTANRNLAGFSIRENSSGNVIRSNVASGNSAEGFEVVNSNSNQFIEDTANKNRFGFRALGDASSNTFTRNVARSNDEFDAQDDTTGTGNVWSNNKFGTTSGI